MRSMKSMWLQCVSVILGICFLFDLSLGCWKPEHSTCCVNYYESGGTCLECPLGTFGVDCSSVCPAGYYGQFCIYQCNCSFGLVCDTKEGCRHINFNPTATKEPEKTSLDWSMISGLLVFGSLVGFLLIPLIICANKYSRRRNEQPENIEALLRALNPVNRLSRILQHENRGPEQSVGAEGKEISALSELRNPADKYSNRNACKLSLRGLLPTQEETSKILMSKEPSTFTRKVLTVERRELNNDISSGDWDDESTDNILSAIKDNILKTNHDMKPSSSQCKHTTSFADGFSSREIPFKTFSTEDSDFITVTFNAGDTGSKRMSENKPINDSFERFEEENTALLQNDCSASFKQIEEKEKAENDTDDMEEIESKCFLNASIENEIYLQNKENIVQQKHLPRWSNNYGGAEKVINNDEGVVGPTLVPTQCNSQSYPPSEERPYSMVVSDSPNLTLKNQAIDVEAEERDTIRNTGECCQKEGNVSTYSVNVEEQYRITCNCQNLDFGEVNKGSQKRRAYSMAFNLASDDQSSELEIDGTRVPKELPVELKILRPMQRESSYKNVTTCDKHENASFQIDDAGVYEEYGNIQRSKSTLVRRLTKWKKRMFSNLDRKTDREISSEKTEQKPATCMSLKTQQMKHEEPNLIQTRSEQLTSKPYSLLSPYCMSVQEDIAVEKSNKKCSGPHFPKDVSGEQAMAATQFRPYSFVHPLNPIAHSHQ